MTYLAAILSLFLNVQTTRATRYADTPRDEGGTPACHWRIPWPTYRRLYPIRCAHRTLPCGTILHVWRLDADRSATCAVLDRGPYGLAAHRTRTTGRKGVGQGHNAWRLLRLARTQPDAFRGDLDLSPGPADRIGLTLQVGRVPVVYWPVETVR